MKILEPAQIRQASESERVRDIARTESIREALDKARRELNNVNAQFEVTLANQRLRWAHEEKEATERLEDLRKETEELIKKREAALIPLDSEKKKAHDLFNEAEAVLLSAREQKRESSRLESEAEHLKALLEEKLDELSDRESILVEKEKKLKVRELAVDEERNIIKKLSKELSVKLSNL